MIEIKSDTLLVYRIYNIIDGKSYIGKCKHGLNRIKEHFHDYKYPKKAYRARLLYQAMNGCGIESFTYEVLDTAETPQELNVKERYFIATFNSISKEFGYNATRGGDGGNTWEGLTHEEREARKTTQSLRQRSTYTEERRKALSERMKKMRADPEKRKKNAEICSVRMRILNKDPNSLIGNCWGRKTKQRNKE